MESIAEVITGTGHRFLTRIDFLHMSRNFDVHVANNGCSFNHTSSNLDDTTTVQSVHARQSQSEPEEDMHVY